MSYSNPRGPVLKGLPPEAQPAPEPACATCPIAVWHRIDNELRCFCRVFQRVSWLLGGPLITDCDAREAELLKGES